MRRMNEDRLQRTILYRDMLAHGKLPERAPNLNLETKSPVFVIDGKPLALERPRFCPKSGRMYDCQKKEKWVWGEIIKLQLSTSWIPWCNIALKLCLRFFIIPVLADTPEGKYHISRPDLSNLVKYIEDVASGIVYTNDCFISVIYASKRWSSNPRTEFWLEVIP